MLSYGDAKSRKILSQRPLLCDFCTQLESDVAPCQLMSLINDISFTVISYYLLKSCIDKSLMYNPVDKSEDNFGILWVVYKNINNIFNKHNSMEPAVAK